MNEIGNDFFIDIRPSVDVLSVTSIVMRIVYFFSAGLLFLPGIR